MKEELGRSAQVTITSVMKNNGVRKDGLTIQQEGAQIAPTVYVDEFYREYCRGTTMPEILEQLLKVYRKNVPKEIFDASFFRDFESVRGLLTCRLINREKNAELLRTVPYQKFLDLALVVFCNVEHDAIGKGAILIHESHLRMWDITKNELFVIARENTRVTSPEELISMGELLREMTGEELITEESPMYVLSNQQRMYGAVHIIFDQVLQKIAEELKGDFWVLPSSIHECIVLPEDFRMTREELERMVHEVNTYEVEEEDILSDRVYYYNRRLHRLS